MHKTIFVYISIFLIIILTSCDPIREGKYCFVKEKTIGANDLKTMKIIHSRAKNILEDYKKFEEKYEKERHTPKANDTFFEASYQLGKQGFVDKINRLIETTDEARFIFIRQRVKILNLNGDYAYIQFENGEECWVPKKALEPE